MNHGQIENCPELRGHSALLVPGGRPGKEDLFWYPEPQDLDPHLEPLEDVLDQIQYLQRRRAPLKRSRPVYS